MTSQEVPSSPCPGSVQMRLAFCARRLRCGEALEGTLPARKGGTPLILPWGWVRQESKRDGPNLAVEGDGIQGGQEHEETVRSGNNQRSNSDRNSRREKHVLPTYGFAFQVRAAPRPAMGRRRRDLGQRGVSRWLSVPTVNRKVRLTWTSAHTVGKRDPARSALVASICDNSRD